MKIKREGHLVIFQDELGEAKIDLLEAQQLLRILEEMANGGKKGGGSGWA